MTGYTKLFSSILTSTIWQEPLATRVLWITMLALSSKDGIVEGSIPGLAHLAGVTIVEADEAIAKLMSPDPYSRSSECEGKRIIAIDGGWLILNRAKYRNKESEEDRREYQRRWMEKKRAAARPVDTNVDKSQHVDSVDTDKDRVISTISSKPSAFDDSQLLPHLQLVWGDYLERTERNPKTYSFTTLRKRKGLQRLRECLDKTNSDLDKAVELMKLATAKLVASDWHMGRDPKTGGKRYCEWDEHLFKSYERMEKWWNS